MRSEQSNDIFEALEQITSALPSKKRAVGVEITQSFAPKSRERIAEFLEFRRAARTKFACNRPVCVTQTSELRCSFCRVGSAFKCKKRESTAVESTQIFGLFSVEVARKNCEILGISASRALKKQCLNSASVRYVLKTGNIVNS